MDRAQIHSLEAFIAALLIVGALLFASQATAVTPLSASTSNQHIENQQQQMAEDMLSIAANNGSLQEALTYWNESDGEDAPAHFAHSEPNRSTYSSVVGEDFDHPLAPHLGEAFGDGVYAYNIDLRYLDEDGDFEEVRMIDMGTPSDNAVTATRTVTLFENDTIANDDVENGPELAELGHQEFWAPNVDSDGSVYNVVEVRVTIWRM